MIPPHLRSTLGAEPGGVFYLYGADEHRKEEAARALAEAHLDPATRDFNLDLLRGSEVHLEALASAVGTPPMMSDWRVVMLRETEALAASPKARDLLRDVLRSPPAGLALILICTPPERSSAKFYHDLQKHTRALEFPVPDQNDLPAWLMEWSRTSFDCELNEDAARALAQAIGGNTALLARELEKLSTLVETGTAITRETVEAAGTSLPRQDRWQWFDLVGEARFDQALRGLPVLLEHGETGVGLTLGLGTHLLRLGVVVDGGRRALEGILPANQKWLARRYDAQARHWTVDGIEEALSGLLEVDQLFKSSRISDTHLLESWILVRMAERMEAH